jgi:hypothetical protein
MHCGVDCEGPCVYNKNAFAFPRNILQRTIALARLAKNDDPKTLRQTRICAVQLRESQSEEITMVNPRRTTHHLPGKQSINLARLPPKSVDDTFDDKSWSQAFHNTVFSAYCPPYRKERKAPRFTVCDFEELPPEHGKPMYKRYKEPPFEGKDCEEEVKEHLIRKVLLSPCTTKLILETRKSCVQNHVTHL